MDETKESRLTPEEWVMLRIALDAYILESKFAAQLNEEFRQQQAAKEALQTKLTKLGLWEQGPFSVVMRVEKGEKEMLRKDWYVITYCKRQDAWDNWIPAEWFVLNAPFATKEEAEATQAKIVESTKGTDAEWPEANAAAKIVHRDELAQYGLKPLNERDENNDL